MNVSQMYTAAQGPMKANTIVIIIIIIIYTAWHLVDVLALSWPSE